MTQKNPEYKGYEIIGQRNKNIVARIIDNIHQSERTGFMNHGMVHEPNINFVFTSYDTMVKFIDENAR